MVYKWKLVLDKLGVREDVRFVVAPLLENIFNKHGAALFSYNTVFLKSMYGTGCCDSDCNVLLSVAREWFERDLKRIKGKYKVEKKPVFEV